MCGNFVYYTLHPAAICIHNFDAFAAALHYMWVEYVEWFT